MKMTKLPALCVLASAVLSTPVHAHFKLLSPTSWLNEDDLGAPQKGAPCGPGGMDDMPETPFSMAVTTVKGGETIMVEFEETIHHPGWFRISLAQDPSEFADLDFSGPGCSYDLSTVPTGPHDNVLMDGIGMNEDVAGSNRKFAEMVTIPDEPCEKCTLQVIQVMADTLHNPPGCIYYHCAELKIVAAGDGAMESDGTAMAEAGSGAEGAAGMGGDAEMASGAVAASGGAAAAAGSGADESGAAGSSGASTTASVTAGGAAPASADAAQGASPGSSASGTSPASSTASAMSDLNMASASSAEGTGKDADADASAPAADSSGGGCAVARSGASAEGLSVWLTVSAGLFLGLRRRGVARRTRAGAAPASSAG